MSAMTLNRLLLLLASLLMPSTAFAEIEAPPKPKWALVIHGGAGAMERGKIAKEKDIAIRIALKGALDVGSQILENGGSSVDAVEAAVRFLEDDPNFNAGKGAVLTYDGTISLDAAIMDGRTRKAGAIAGTTIAKNPITAARKVMDDSPHVLLAGVGADAFVTAKGLDAERDLANPPRLDALQKLLAYFPDELRRNHILRLAWSNPSVSTCASRHRNQSIFL